MAIIPYKPLPDIGERLNWATSVNRAYSGEARRRLRGPRQVMTIRWNVKDVKVDYVRQFYRDNQFADVDVPFWKDASRTDVGAADTTITCDTNGEYVPGGRILIWKDCDTYLIRTIDAVNDGSIDITAAVGVDLSGVAVMPLYEGRMLGGVKTKRIWHRASFLWAFEIDFEVDGTDWWANLFGLDGAQVTLAIDASGSMVEEVETGVTRMDVAKANAVSVLDFLEQTGLDNDIHVLGWSRGSPQSTVATSANASDYDTLRTAVNAITIEIHTDFDEAFYLASTFYSGTKPRIHIFITDGEAVPGTIAPAIALRDAVDDLQVYGFNIDLTDTTDTDQIDNTGGAVVIPDGNDTTLYEQISLAIRLSNLGSPFYRGIPVYDCGGYVIQPIDGLLGRAATIVDSGLGERMPVATFEDVDESWAIDFRQVDADKKMRDRFLWHYLSGRHMPLYVPETPLTIVSATTTTVTVEPMLTDVTDYIGRVLWFGSEAREVTAATTSGSDHQLTFATATTPTTAWLMRLVRGLTDSIEVEHYQGFRQRALVGVKDDLL